MDKEFIKSLIPHRDPFIFVDRIIEVNNSSIHAQLDVKLDMPFFRGHFPQKPIMPGVLTLEALAQTAGLLIALSRNGGNGAGRIFYLAATNVKFLKPLEPDSVLELNCRILKEFGGLCQFEVEACARKSRIAAGTIVLAEAKGSSE